MGKSTNRRDVNPEAKCKLIQELNEADNQKISASKRSRTENLLPRAAVGSNTEGMNKISTKYSTKNDTIVSVVTENTSNRKILKKNELQNKLVNLALKGKKVNGPDRYDQPKVKSKIVVPVTSRQIEPVTWPKRTVKPPARFIDTDDQVNGNKTVNKARKGGVTVQNKDTERYRKSKIDLDGLNSIDLHSSDEVAVGNAVLGRQLITMV